jgi:trimeric autotransporter adhesin
VSPTTLTTVIPDSDMDSLGTAYVSVMTAWPGQPSRESTARTFAIDYPVPTISSMSPASVRLGVSSTLLSINGTGFTPRSIVTINGRQASELRPLGYDVLWQGNVVQSYLDSARVVQVRVENPTPGGGDRLGDDAASDRAGRDDHDPGMISMTCHSRGNP